MNKNSIKWSAETPKIFPSYQSLVYFCHAGMPDCYPEPMANYIADDMLEHGVVKILDKIVIEQQ